MELDKLIALNQRLVEMIIHDGQEAHNGWIDTFNVMLDSNKWFLIKVVPDPKIKDHFIASDISVNFSFEEAEIHLAGLKNDLEATDKIQKEVNDLLE